MCSEFATPLIHIMILIQWNSLSSKDKKSVLVRFANNRLGVERCLAKVQDLEKIVKSAFGDF